MNMMVIWNRRSASGLLLAALMLFAVGCDDLSHRTPKSSLPAEPQALRIVSLSPALTQMLVDLGYAQSLVGVSNQDAAAPPGLQVVGSYQDVDAEAMRSVNPTLILTMSDDGKAPKRLRNLASRSKATVAAYPYPHSVQDVSKILYDHEQIGLNQPTEASLCLGQLLDNTFDALVLVARMSEQLGRLDQMVSDKRRVRVLMVIGTNPVMVSGPGTVHNDLLSFIGAINAAADATVEAPILDREAILAAQPEVILFLIPGAPDLQPIDRDARLAPFRGLDLPAIKNQHVTLINDPLVLLPSTSLADIGIQMAKAIHPELATQIDQVVTGQIEPITPDTDVEDALEERVRTGDEAGG